MRRAFLLGMTLLVAAPVNAEFGVQGATPVILYEPPNERDLAVNTRLLLRLNPVNEEALHNGIPLEIVIDLEFLRQRWWWTNKLIADWRLRRQLSFHALSRKYVVSATSVKQRAESFSTLEQALTHAGNLSRLELALTPKKQIEPGARHLLRVRVRLDIETLPVVMRPLAYTSPAWRLNSGWTSWPVQQ